MSLDITIRYKRPRRVNNNATRADCGSNAAVCNAGEVFEETEGEVNITRNMAEMACHIPVSVMYRNKDYKGTLYDYVWHPDKHGNVTTASMSRILVSGIAYMVASRKELLLYNPVNGWGSYDAFLLWLTKYKEVCEDNPGCKIMAEGGCIK